MIPHEELFHYEPVFLPPPHTNQKRVSPGASGQSGCFRIQKQPLADVTDRIAGIGRNEPQRPGTHHFSAAAERTGAAHGCVRPGGWSGFRRQADASIARSSTLPLPPAGLPASDSADAKPPLSRASPQTHPSSYSTLESRISNLESIIAPGSPAPLPWRAPPFRLRAPRTTDILCRTGSLR